MYSLHVQWCSQQWDKGEKCQGPLLAAKKLSKNQEKRENCVKEGKKTQ